MKASKKTSKPKSTQKLPTIEKPFKVDMSFNEVLQKALNTPIKKSRVKK
jgi:hypothetical protein